MTDLLKEILGDKRRELDTAKESVPLKEMISRVERTASETKRSGSFLKALSVPGRVSIIAEMKRKSPSAGLILNDFDPAGLAGIYEKGGASAISVLTEKKHFNGTEEDLLRAGRSTRLPILRKDFIFDPYQVYQSRVWGAQALLLIVRILSRSRFSQLLRLAESLMLDSLVEVHSEEDLKVALGEGPVRCIGVNNRNLSSLEIDLETAFRFASRIPKGVIAVAESGIKTPQTVRRLREAGFSAALIGETILKSKDKLKTLQSFVKAGYV